MKEASIVLCLILCLIAGQAAAVTLGISADGRFFTIDGVPTYLNGISYYGGLQITTPSMVTQDLDDMVARGINWIRVWTFWSYGGESAAITDLNGNVRQPYMSRLKTIITEANNRGMIVDVTMSRDTGLNNISQYTNCARTIATELLAYRNVYIDIGNERDVGDSRYISIPDCGNIINAIKAIDPNRICTASGTPSSQSDLNYFLTTGRLDFIATHLCRDSGCSALTYGTVRTYVTWMTNLGKRVPVHLQEPFRRGYTTYQPVQEDYYRDDSGGKAAEAAGWCLHNGSQSGGGWPYRSFWMNDSNGRLFAQLDSVEQEAASNISDAIGGASWTVRRYQAEYTEQIPHQIGRKEGLFWSANVAQDSAGYLNYGPYLNGIPAGVYRAAFRLMIDNNTADNNDVALLDVYSGGVVIAQRAVRRKDFNAANVWQTFNIDYTSTGQQALEFRTYWYDNCYLKIDHITLSSNPAPDVVTGFTAVGGETNVQLSWTNPMTPTFTGTMIRVKTSGYPTSETDGTLVCDRAAAPAGADNFLHENLNQPIYFYAAYAHDGSGRYSPAAYASALTGSRPDWLDEKFDNYTNGDITGQGGWITGGVSGAQVQSSVYSGAGGKAILMDCIAAGTSIENQIYYTRKTSGYYYLQFDARQNTTGTVGSDFASVSIYGPSSTTEIGKVRIQKGRLQMEYGSGTTAIFTASAANDTWYRITVGINIDTKKFDLWLDGISKGTNYSWKGAGVDIDKIVISSVRNTALSVQQAYIDNFAYGAGPGAIPAAYDDGTWTPSLSKLRFFFDPAPNGAEYRYAIGTTSGGTQVRSWTDCGASTDVTVSGLSLVENQSYYVSILAHSGHGIWGPTAKNTNGIKPAPGLASIRAAKALGDASTVYSLRNKLVSATFPGYFYVQEQGDYCGLKVVSTKIVSAGDWVDVAGFMGGSATERFIDCTNNGVIKTTPGPGGPYPMALASASVGGKDLYPTARGVVGGKGPNNVGSLIRVFGRVTQTKTTDPKYFYIDDGNGLKDGTSTDAVENVGIRVNADPSGYEGDYVVVTGVVSCFDASGLRPLILPSSIEVSRSGP